MSTNGFSWMWKMFLHFWKWKIPPHCFWVNPDFSMLLLKSVTFFFSFLCKWSELIFLCCLVFFTDHYWHLVKHIWLYHWHLSLRSLVQLVVCWGKNWFMKSKFTKDLLINWLHMLKKIPFFQPPPTFAFLCTKWPMQKTYLWKFKVALKSWYWNLPLEIILANSPAQAGPARAGCSGLCPIRFWKSPQMETPPPLWATCSLARSPWQ